MVSVDVTFLLNTHFSPDPIHTSRGDDDLFVYTLASPAPVSVLPLTKPPITQVYVRCLLPLVSSPPSVASTLDPVQFFVMTFLLLFVKVNVNVLIKSPPFALITIITICHSILVRLLHP